MTYTAKASIGVKFEDMFVSKLIDVLDYMSKWRNGIVKKVDRKAEKITVVMESGLELELTKDDIVGPIILIASRITKEKRSSPNLNLKPILEVKIKLRN